MGLQVKFFKFSCMYYSFQNKMVAKYIAQWYLISRYVPYILTYDVIYIELPHAFQRGACYSNEHISLWKDFPLFLVWSSANSATVNIVHTSSYSNILPLTSLWDTVEMLAWKGFVQLTKWYISKLFFQKIARIFLPTATWAWAPDVVWLSELR